MKRLIELTTEEQVEAFKKLGYEVKSYVEVSTNKANGQHRAAPVKRIMGDAKVTLSVEGREPVNGKYGAIWPKLKRQLWGDDPGAIYTRHEVVATLKKLGNKDTTMTSYLINHCKCIRVVEQ